MSWAEIDKKKIFLVLGLFILIAIGIFFGAQYFVNRSAQQAKIEQQSEADRKTAVIKRQLEELDALRNAASSTPITAEEQKKQIDDIDNLRDNKKNSSPGDIDKQLNELDNLRKK